ncbi:hypothetical protein [Bizionia arctica]|uniref:Uncharacterized protein n=1 Tax=Bizionia arctica TaxID=1495645 RepID=A0A917GPV1_9FLAO|nr:hypothetical protein [Bizionia arctica]GGG53079.1 hypothetical protein GCM10010976_25180 [Bizionia arctica]
MIHFLYHYFLTKKPAGKENKLKRWLVWQLYKYLKVALVRYYKNRSKEALGTDSDSNVIVSLTSFPARIDIVYLVIKSILNQTVRPNKIVLWLGIEQFPDGVESLPISLLELRPLGLDIEFCEDIKAHKKYYFAFQKYPENLIVTVDDDVIYPKDLLKVLLETHKRYPNSVVANRVRYMKKDGDSYVPYREWKINKVKDAEPSKYIFSTGVGGVLYQPSFFKKSFFDLEGIKKTDCRNDDIWLKAGQIANNIPVVFTNYYYNPLIEIPDSQKESLFSNNVFEADNDRQIIEIFDYFGITEASFE